MWYTVSMSRNSNTYATDRNNRLKDILGETISNATYKLRKILLFEFAKRLDLHHCFRCGEPIDNIDEFTVDHVLSWRLHKSRELFYDIDNIKFSHFKCNCANYTKSKTRPNARKNKIKNEEKFCDLCMRFIPLAQFHKKSNAVDGYQTYCKRCHYLKKGRTRKYNSAVIE